MARRDRKNQAFNAPFHDLKLPPSPISQAATEPPKGGRGLSAKGQQASKPTSAGSQAEGGGSADNDSSLFLRAMSGVKAIDDHRPSRIEPAKNLERRGPDDEALALMEFESFVRGDTPFALTDTEEFQCGLAPGVTHQLLETLRHGEFAFHRHLDLHGLSREEAHQALANFIIDSRHGDERCVLVITGRGKSSPGGISVIKEALPRWLSRAPVRAHVLAFCTALPVHGGPGAFYVLLRRQGQRPFGVNG